jgi:hypothetical protein
MKNFRTLCASVLMLVAFSVPVCAGNITTGRPETPRHGAPPKGNITTGRLENSGSLREVATQLLHLIAVHHVNLY